MLNAKRAQFLKQQEKVQARSAKDAALRSQSTAPKGHASQASTKPPASPVLHAQNWLQDQEKYNAMITVKNYPLAAKVKKVIDYLFLERRQVDAKEIEDFTYVDIIGNTDLIESLRQNPKISFSGELYEYKAKHSLNEKEDLLRLIRKHKDGIPFADVKDSYTEVQGDVQDLKLSGKIWVLQNSESQEDILYPNDPKIEICVDEDLRKLIREIELPREFVDVERELLKAGMKPASNTARRQALASMPREQKQKPKQRKRRESKRTKYTNAHLPELFQNIEMPPGL